jgi:hypothetical protein
MSGHSTAIARINARKVQIRRLQKATTLQNEWTQNRTFAAILRDAHEDIHHDLFLAHTQFNSPFFNLLELDVLILCMCHCLVSPEVFAKIQADIEPFIDALSVKSNKTIIYTTPDFTRADTGLAAFIAVALEKLNR